MGACRHEKTTATDTHYVSGRFKGRDETCLQCGARWRYEPCGECGRMKPEAKPAPSGEEE